MTSKIALLASLLIGFSGFAAGAAVLPNADFVAQQCGPQMIDTAHKDTHVMQAACVGFINGTKTRAVTFTLSNDQVFLFKVVGQSNLMMVMASGASMTVFRLLGVDGEMITMKAVVNQDGSVKSMSGVFQTNAYIVPVLETLLSLQ